MNNELSAADMRKREAARAALEHVRSGMKLGLGTGSTAAQFLQVLAEKVRDGLDVVGVPTSERTRQSAEQLGIPLTTLDEMPRLDLTIDGADEVDGELRLIKGGGGALLIEKIVATASDRMIVIADDSKRVAQLGAFPLPIEIVPFGARATTQAIARLARHLGLDGPLELREGPDGKPFMTDCRHYIVDAAFGAIGSAEALAAGLNAIPGVVEHGLFLGIADTALFAGEGGVQISSGAPR